MADIYKSASRVLVYLGEAADDSDEALELLDRIANTDLGGPEQQFVPLSRRETGLPPHDNKGWAAIRSLLRRPWFRRAWVIQEFVMGADVTMICGEASVSWMIILVAIHKTNEA